MRRKLLVGNWKMHKTVAESRVFAEELGRNPDLLSPEVDFAVCPPFTSLQILRVLLPTVVQLGAQNVHFEPKGAFTGEISVEMLAELGVHYVIAGHSERRHVFSESDAWVRQKVHAIAGAGLVPILCVGEDLRQRELNHTLRVVERQTIAGLTELSEEQVAQSVIAYEPVWAIGSGMTATPEDAEKVIAAIRDVVKTEKGDYAAANVRILYGGSVKPDNIAAFMKETNVDGALVGGASLDAKSYLQLAQAMVGGLRE
jgi:triosephosphate isomerase (TIM)